MRKTAVILLLLMLVSAFSGCAAGKGLKKYQATYLDLFDTVTVITGYEKDKKSFEENAKLIYDELKQYHMLFDIYNEYEGVVNLMTINNNAGVKPVEADKKLIDMLKYASLMKKETGGMFNIALGSVLSLWHEAREYGITSPDKAYLPDSAALKEAAKHTDIDDMILDEEKGTVYLSDAAMSLDAGGIGKGWAVEAVSSLLREKGISGYLIAVGGNVESVGPKGDGSGWVVGIENPDSSGGDAYKHILQIKDKTVVTSGSYQRYYTVNGVQYHHIIDPVTLYPKNTFVLVTVISDNSARADVLTTALFNMTQEEGLALIEKTEGTEAYWLYPDGSEVYSDGFSTYVM